MNVIKICKWILEIDNNKIKTYNDFFISDIINFLDLENIIKKSNLESIIKSKLGTKYNTLILCRNKTEVKKWLNETTSYVVKYIDTESILEDYFSL